MVNLNLNKTPLFITLLVTILLMGCTAASPSSTDGTPVIVTATPVPVTPTNTPAPTPVPTEGARVFINYRHPTGVFSLTIPEDWEQIDQSTLQELEVRLIPPAGYGSRILIDGRNVGTLDQNAVNGLLESDLQLQYQENPAYTEINRTEFIDDMMRIEYQFDDGLGARGRETFNVYYVEPFYLTMRVFMAEADTPFLGRTLVSVMDSISIDPLADWGTRIGSINPAELRLLNAYVWRARDEVTYYMGELQNNSPSDISEVVIHVGFCDAANIVIAETEAEVVPQIIEQGETVPFSIGMEGMPEGVTVCQESVRAVPAEPDPGYTSSLTVNIFDLSYHQWRRDLTLQGEVYNPTLSPVKNIEVLLAAYDGDNRVTGYIVFELELDEPLQPGASTPFEIVITAINGEPDHLATLAQARIFNLDNPSIAPTP